MDFDLALEKAEKGKIDQSIAVSLFAGANNWENVLRLFSAASSVRDTYLGRDLRMTAHIHMVTPCYVYPPCLYCSLSSSLQGIREERYSITPDEVERYVRYAIERKVSSIVLVGGASLAGLDEKVKNLVKRLRDITDVDISLNVGPSLSLNTLRWLKKESVSTIYSSLETINTRVFRKAKPGDSLSERIALMKNLEREDLNLGSIVMSGLGSNIDLINSIFYLRKYRNLSHLHISVFHPVPGTPWQKRKQASLFDSLKALSVARLAFPKVQVGLAEVGIESSVDMSQLPMELVAGGGNTYAAVLLYKKRKIDNRELIKRIARSLKFGV